eukprot:1050751-Ditylum_brightwellii.AAC.1
MLNNHHLATTQVYVDLDATSTAIIAKIQEGGNWSVKHLWVAVFSISVNLHHLQRHNSSAFLHSVVKTELLENDTHRNVACVLCSSTGVKKDTTYMCSTYQVPLCNVPQKNLQKKLVGNSCLSNGIYANQGRICKSRM